MALDSNTEQMMYLRVKGMLKTLAINQKDLAKRLGLAQGVVSLALSGGNEKTFRRITDLLVQEYGIDPQQIFGETERGDKIMNQLEAIQAELVELRSEIKELKGLVQPKPRS
jgi:transcriptional regulator with XRE-family HTH domain